MGGGGMRGGGMRGGGMRGGRSGGGQGAGYRKPSEPIEKEMTGGMARGKSDDAHSSVPSPPKQTTTSTLRDMSRACHGRVMDVSWTCLTVELVEPRLSASESTSSSAASGGAPLSPPPPPPPRPPSTALRHVMSCGRLISRDLGSSRLGSGSSPPRREGPPAGRGGVGKV